MPTQRCQTCSHKAVSEIDALLLSMDVTTEGHTGASYEEIIMRMRTAHPQEQKLTKSGLSRHKTNHLLARPVALENTQTGEITYYGKNSLVQNPVTEKDIPPIPTVKASLQFIVAAGLQNIARNSYMVGPKVLVEALTLLERLTGVGDEDTLKDAWAALAAEQKKAGRGTKVSRTTTVREEVELPAPHDEPDETVEWSFDALPALPGATNDNS